MAAARKPIPLNQISLKELGDACGTDKTSHHGYHRFYPLFLAPLRKLRRFAIVEIGFGEGKSIPFWRSLFPKAHVYCLDRDVSQIGEGFTVLKVDQGDPPALEAAIDTICDPVHLVIDDGSHFPPHQLLTFSLFFEKMLVPGGVYIIEDIETSYWLLGDIYGYQTRFGLYSPWSAIEILKLAVDYLNRTVLSEQDRSLIEYSMSVAGLSPAAAEQVAMLSFAQNCVIATKMNPGDSAYVERPYPYALLTARD